MFLPFLEIFTFVTAVILGMNASFKRPHINHPAIFDLICTGTNVFVVEMDIVCTIRSFKWKNGIY